MNSDNLDTDPPPEIKEALHALSVVFVGRIPGYLASMQKEITNIESDSDNLEPWTSLHMLLHTIAGSAGSFGYTELGVRSREIEHRISAAIKSTDPQHCWSNPNFQTAFIDEMHPYMRWVSHHFNSN